MKHRWVKAGLTLAGVAAASVALLMVFGAHEPSARGKSASFWVGQLGKPGANQTQARAALAEIGPGLIPFLIEDVRGEEPLGRTVYRAIWTHLPARLQTRLARPRMPDNGWLGKVATALTVPEPPAVPQLITALNDPKIEVRLVAVRAISILGPKAGDAVPALIKACDDPQPEVQMEAVLALDRMGGRRKEAVPALITLLSANPDRASWASARVKEAAVLILGNIGPDAKAALPRLTQLLSDPYPRLRQRSALALWRISQDPSVVSRLAGELAQANDFQSCAFIITSLGEIGSAAKEALPVILEKASQQNIPGDRFALKSLKNVARRAVGKIDRETAEQMVKPDAYVPDLRSGALMDSSTAGDLGLKPGAP